MDRSYQLLRRQYDELLGENARLRQALRDVRKNIPGGCSTAFVIINAALTGVERKPSVVYFNGVPVDPEPDSLLMD